MSNALPKQTVEQVLYLQALESSLQLIRLKKK
jgi:hypothetical protein